MTHKQRAMFVYMKLFLYNIYMAWTGRKKNEAIVKTYLIEKQKPKENRDQAAIDRANELVLRIEAELLRRPKKEDNDLDSKGDIQEHKIYSGELELSHI